MDLESKLPYFRDRLAEGYFWVMGVCFEPKYSFARKIQVKIICILVVIDDTYDVHGKIGELRAFTKAIHRFVDFFKYYMK